MEPTEQVYPGLLTIIIGVVLTLWAADAHSVLLTLIGLLLVAAGAYTLRKRAPR